MTPRGSIRLGVAVLLAVAVAVTPGGCGDDDEGSTATITTPSADATSSTAAGDEGGGSAEAPRQATMAWGDEERTFALATCESASGDLLVSGDDDEGYLIVIEVTGGSGTAFVSAPDTLETQVEATITGFEMGGDGTFSTSGSTTGATNGANDFTLEGTCGGS